MSNAQERAAATPFGAWLELGPEERAAWAGFLRAHARITRALDAELEQEHGLPLTSYDVLAQLALANGRLRMSELADSVLLSRSGVTRLVDRLERDGLVRRERGQVDPRQIYACLNDSGRELLAEATPTHVAGIKGRFLERLSDDQKKALAAIWRAVSPSAGSGE